VHGGTESNAQEDPSNSHRHPITSAADITVTSPHYSIVLTMGRSLLETERKSFSTMVVSSTFMLRERISPSRKTLFLDFFLEHAGELCIISLIEAGTKLHKN
jgi:hypothetical protein